MRYRTADERERVVRDDDPLKIFRAKVIDAACLGLAQLDAVDRAVASRRGHGTIRSAAPYPNASDLTTDVYFVY